MKIAINATKAVRVKYTADKNEWHADFPGWGEYWGPSFSHIESMAKLNGWAIVRA